MPVFYRIVLFVCTLGGLLVAPPALAQRATLRQVQLNGTGDFTTLPGGYSFVHHFVPTDGVGTVFRHVVLDSALRPRHQRDLKLGGRGVELLSYATNQRAALYEFRRYNDSVVTAVIDTAGQVLSVRREARRSHKPRVSVQLPVRSDSLFLVYEASSGFRRFRLHCLDLHQHERWQLTFAPRRGRTSLASFSADGQYAWVVAADNYYSRRVEHTAYCLELATGKIVSTTLLDNDGERRIACQTLVQPDHSLALVGRAYHSRRISRISSGDLFVTRLTPAGTRLLDRSSPLGSARNLGSSRRTKTYWQSLVADPAGNLRLVGQTFTSTSWGANFAMAVASRLLTLNILQISFTTLRPRDILSFQISPEGELLQARMLPIPERNSYTTVGYVQAQLMAELAAGAGVFPVRGLTPDGRQAILRTKKQLYLLDLDTQRQRLLRDANTLGSNEVWGVRTGRVLLYQTGTQGPQTLDLEQLAYDK
ncbi:MAG: hypothetical protein EOO59_06065 [Hymenobacter sp.]|nr:MAG: hypothetical protein EOO59_06065 [Hymenobacter sp.]